MKRIVTVVLGVGFLVGLCVSHLAMAKGPPEKVTICHITDEEVVGDQLIRTGHEITISEKALEAHLNHGDLLEYRLDRSGVCGEGVPIPDESPR